MSPDFVEKCFKNGDIAALRNEETIVSRILLGTQRKYKIRQTQRTRDEIAQNEETLALIQNKRLTLMGLI